LSLLFGGLLFVVWPDAFLVPAGQSFFGVTGMVSRGFGTKVSLVFNPLIILGLSSAVPFSLRSPQTVNFCFSDLSSPLTCSEGMGPPWAYKYNVRDFLTV